MKVTFTLFALLISVLSFAQEDKKLGNKAFDYSLKPLNTLTIDKGFERIHPSNVKLSDFNTKTLTTADNEKLFLKLGANPFDAERSTIVIEKKVHTKMSDPFQSLQPLIILKSNEE